MTTTTERPRTEWDTIPVPIERWGKDHWSTFAYIETRCVDHDGYADMRHLRGHPGRRPEQYPTRLQEGDLGGHDDLDCLTDAVAAGLLEGGRATQRNGRGEIKALTYRYTLTPAGTRVAGALRQWISARCGYHHFTPVASAVLARGITASQVERMIAARQRERQEG